jgi:hypothetical protein
MKKLLAIGGLLLIAFALWLYAPARREVVTVIKAPPQVELPKSTSPPVVIATPVPLPVSAASPAEISVTKPIAAVDVTPVKRTAPPGVFYMLERVSKITDDGAVGLNPGAKVHVLERSGETLRVSDGHIAMDVHTSDVTDDLDLAEQIAKQHASSQQAFIAWIEKQKQIARQLEKEDADRQLEKDKIEAQRAASSPHVATAQPKPSVNALDRGAYNQHHGVSHGPYYGYRYGYRYYVTSDGQTIYY